MVFRRNRKAATNGQMVELSQPANGETVWLPFLVTHVHDGEQISGVCFSGMPGALGWMNRAAQAFDHVEKGSGMREWRFKRGRPADEPDEPEDQPESYHTPEEELPFDEDSDGDREE